VNELTKNSAQRAHAEAQFAARAVLTARAKSEHEAAARAGYEKTARLRSLRLAKEAAEKALNVSGNQSRSKSG
jgi:hypothetical protein